MFRRRRDRQDDEPGTNEDVVEPDGDDAPDEATDTLDHPRAGGPFDLAEVGEDALEQHIDLGGLWLPGREGMELRIDVDEASGSVGAVTVVHGASALQVQPFAAPRREGIWDDVRAEIAAGITQQGGTATEKDGTLGIELHARVPVALEDGTTGAQLARFVGVDGPRWFLRGVLTGDAYSDPVAAAPLEEVFRGIIVVRDGTPMAPREPITMRLPAAPAAAQEVEAEPAAPSLDPFERGPEITEVR